MATWKPSDSIVFAESSAHVSSSPRSRRKRDIPSVEAQKVNNGTTEASAFEARAPPPKRARYSFYSISRVETQAACRPLYRQNNENASNPESSASSLDTNSSAELESLDPYLPSKLSGMQQHRGRSSSLRATMGGELFTRFPLQSDSENDSSIEIITRGNNSKALAQTPDQLSCPTSLFKGDPEIQSPRRVFGPLASLCHNTPRSPSTENAFDFVKPSATNQTTTCLQPQSSITSVASGQESTLSSQNASATQISASSTRGCRQESSNESVVIMSAESKEARAPSRMTTEEKQAATRAKKAEKERRDAILERKIKSMPKFTWNNRDGRCNFTPPVRRLFTASDSELATALAKLKPGPVGFDMEWNFTIRRGQAPRQFRTAIIQISDASQVIIFSISRAPDYQLPQCLCTFLSDDKYFKLGVNIAADFRKLKGDFPALPPVNGIVELTHLARAVQKDTWIHKGAFVALRELAAVHAEVNLEKGDERTSDWERQGPWQPNARQMTNRQLDCMAMSS